VVVASVIDRLIFVPAVLLPGAIAGVFPHVLVTFTLLDMSLAVAAWAARTCDMTGRSTRPTGRRDTPVAITESAVRAVP
jgi:hypothetical protein